MTDRAAVLFMTHRWGPVLRMKFRRLRREIGERADVFALMERSPQQARSLAQWPLAKGRVQEFVTAELAPALGYPMFGGNTVARGSTHYPPLLFAIRNPAYDRFLVIEYDVDFSGDWGELFDAAAAADFSALHLRSRTQVPGWPYWKTMRPAGKDRGWAADPDNVWRSFNPLYCITRAGFDLVHHASRSGWSAHFEALLPTILSHHGCRIIDLAAGERFCTGAEQDPLPGSPVSALATFRWRPNVTPREFLERSTGRTLFHPVKGLWAYDGARLVGMRPGAGER